MGIAYWRSAPAPATTPPCSHRLGAVNVFSVDLEPDLIELARARLGDLGYHPTLVAGDGAAGLAEHAPFDRIIATCSVPVIPTVRVSASDPWATMPSSLVASSWARVAR